MWLIVAGIVLFVLAYGATESYAMLIKDESVDIGGVIEHEMVSVMGAVERAYQRRSIQPVLTDYRRPGTGSLHNIGLAMDFRTFDVPMDQRNSIAFEVSQELGPAYRAIREEDTHRWYWRAGISEGTRSDMPSVAPHLHVEYNP